MTDQPEHNRPPADVVPPSGLTLETLARLNEMAGQSVTVGEPGHVVLDIDGIPAGVGPSTVTSAVMAGGYFSRAELDRLGGHPDDYPNLTFI